MTTAVTGVLAMSLNVQYGYCGLVNFGQVVFLCVGTPPGPGGQPDLSQIETVATGIGEALDGRYRPEHLTELRCCLLLWETYQEVIADLDMEIAAHLRSMAKQTQLPQLPPKPRLRGRI